MGFFDDVVKTMGAINPAATLSNIVATGGLAGVNGTTGLDGARSDMAIGVQEANDYLRQAFERQEGYAKPYQDIGAVGLAGLQNFQADPGYQFRLNQGLSGINNSLASRGLANSGRALKALTQYNQDFATNEYNNVFNRNMGLAGLGQNAYQNLGNWAGQYGSGVAGNKMQQAQGNAAYNIARQNRGDSFLQQGVGMVGSLLGGLL